ncbi:VOC family protein [uncultured Dokdonia sp.]|uniref:VOC family protein n=1 Tax=uncultured Dokdonia sp. TaxID=575653 RepID=UPI00262F8371|nr:VOC family protein [uncultured Dokdonia sp.]
MNTAFHFAFKVKDIQSTIRFYHDILGCEKGRETENWVDFNFFGHQLSAHVSKNRPPLDFCGFVEELKVPIPHFGCVLEHKDFEIIKERLQNNGLDFIIKPQDRYKGLGGEQQTMFVLDFSDNPLEFKSYKYSKGIFAN